MQELKNEYIPPFSTSIFGYFACSVCLLFLVGGCNGKQKVEYAFSRFFSKQNKSVRAEFYRDPDTGMVNSAYVFLNLAEPISTKQINGIHSISIGTTTYRTGDTKGVILSNDGPNVMEFFSFSQDQMDRLLDAVDRKDISKIQAVIVELKEKHLEN